MLTRSRSMGLFGVNATLAVFGPAKQVVSPCSGMDRVVGEFAYSGGAPASAPTIEFSMNGSDWDTLQSAPAGANPAPGVTLYTIDIQVFSWAFVRLTVQPPVGSVRGSSRILPKIQN